MQRYNIFYLVHKGLRQMLYQTSSHLQQTDFTNADETAVLQQQITEVLDLFDEHAGIEDHFIIPAIENFEPTVASLFEEEHLQDHSLANRMRALLNMFHHAVSSDEKLEMGSAIRLAFSEFLVFNIQHMAKEERLLNNFLWQHYTDGQLESVTQQIITHVPPETALKNNTWMMRGLSNNEICGWLKKIKNQAPEPVFEKMLCLAEKELVPNRWRTVQEDMTEGALLA